MAHATSRCRNRAPPGLSLEAWTSRFSGAFRDIETIAIGNAIREIRRLRRHYGFGRWRKRKGIARVELRSGTIRLAEIHWYEAHGIGRYELKIKEYLD